jgi:hypothetical protein
MSLLEFEKKYQDYLLNQYDELYSLYNNIKLNAGISLKTKEITKAILLRMKAFYDTNYKIKKFLNKKYVPAAADFFVETVLFYLKLILDKYKKQLEVFSERQIKRHRGYMRPDISIWDNDKVIAIIECKTNLGWNRIKWENDFIAREIKLKKDFPEANAFLLIMTSNNWPGIPKDNINLGDKYFILSKVWLTRITNENFDSIIINPIEDLFKKLI